MRFVTAKRGLGEKGTLLNQLRKRLTSRVPWPRCSLGVEFYSLPARSLGGCEPSATSQSVGNALVKEVDHQLSCSSEGGWDWQGVTINMIRVMAESSA